MRFSDHEDKKGEFFVYEDGSGGYSDNGRRIYRGLIPEGQGWRDWPEAEKPMRVKDKEALKAVRTEIARRWAEVMESYVKNEN